MKKIFLLIILEILLFSKIQAQIITQEQKDSIITDLNSTQWATVDYAKDGVIFYKIYEALPLLQSEIWNKNNYSRLSFVKAMFGLEFESTINYALALFDSLTGNMYSEYDTIFIKLDLIEILFELNNFSKIYYLSYYTNPPYSKPYNYKIIKLWGYLLNVPEYTQLAKAKLQTLMSESTDETDRSLSLFLLGKKYKEEISPLVIARFSTESAFSIRVTILSEYFPLGEAELVSEILRSSLEIENNSLMQRMIINYLLDSLNTPSNFNFIKNWLEGEGSNSRLKKTINILIEYGNKGNPIIPSQNSNVDEIVDSTQSYLIQCNNYGWIENTEFVNDLQSILQSAQANLLAGDSLACREDVKSFQDSVDFVYADSLNTDPRFVTLEGWKFLYWNAQYILDRLPEPQTNPHLIVNLKNSLGNQIPASNVKYYDASWKDAVNNGDGTYTVITTKPTVSIRVFYEYASKQADNVPAQNNTYTFTTFNAAVQLKNSLGNLIDAGTVQYYAGAWRSFGTTSNGVAYKELLPINYSFRMTYEFGSIDKQQNLSDDPTVVFQTVNAAVQLKNSLGNLIDLGTVQYYAGAWRSFGTTSNGVANKELLPVNYSFRMTHEFVSNDKQQNLSTNPVVEFSTVLCSVRVSRTSNNQPINNAAVKYYSVAWRDIGQTNAEGIVTKELLPKNLSFRAILGNVSQDKQQDIGVNNMVEIQLNTQ